MSIAWIVALPTPVPATDEEGEAKEGFYTQLTRAIVRLEEHQSLCTPGREWARERDAAVGSAFFVRDSFEGRDHFFVVTARHVIEGRADLFARVQIDPETDGQAVLILPRRLWSFHPHPTTPGQFPVDVAVMRIPQTPFIKAFLNCPTGGKDGECGREEKTDKPHDNQLVESPAVMERAIFFGFPSGDVATQSPEPFARAGVVAYTAPNPDVKIDGKPVTQDSVYFVDAPSFPGNSGGPVLRERLRLTRGVHLWGLVTGSKPLGKDYTVVTRPEKIAEALSHARSTAKLNEEGWSSKLPDLPVRCVSDK